MKFKKHISILLAFFLLVSNVGFAFNVHYCGGEVASIDPIYLNLDSHSSEKGCCEKKVVKKDNCCKDKIYHFQKKSDHGILKAFSSNVGVLFLQRESEGFIISPDFYSSVNAVASYQCEANAPPFFKLYNQYLFYD